jgi:hypothetical protein
MVGILLGMNKVKLMRQLFDEITEECCCSAVMNRISVVLLNWYAGAHKVHDTSGRTMGSRSTLLDSQARRGV